MTGRRADGFDSYLRSGCHRQRPYCRQDLPLPCSGAIRPSFFVPGLLLLVARLSDLVTPGLPVARQCSPDRCHLHSMPHASFRQSESTNLPLSMYQSQLSYHIHTKRLTAVCLSVVNPTCRRVELGLRPPSTTGQKDSAGGLVTAWLLCWAAYHSLVRCRPSFGSALTQARRPRQFWTI